MRWDKLKVKKLFAIPLLELIYKAQTVHRKHFARNELELATLLNIKTGLCPEDCAYCPQSAHYNTGVKKEKLWQVEDILTKAKIAKESGATRFCMGAAWRSPPEKELEKVITTIKEIKKLGLETCATLGMLSETQAQKLKDANLDYYNHNLDTSRAYYKKIIRTHTYQDRLDTLNRVRKVGIKVCCGGILGMGESQQDRIELLLELSKLPKPPESITINRLLRITGTPLQNSEPFDFFEFVKVIAVARIMMPTSKLRLSAGRIEMSEEFQALCFMAGINSIHFGEKLLTTNNPDMNKDLNMLKKLGIKVRKDVLREGSNSCQS